MRLLVFKRAAPMLKAIVSVSGYTRNGDAVSPYRRRGRDAKREPKRAPAGIIEIGPDRDLTKLSDTELRLELAEAEEEAVKTWKGGFLKKDRIQRVLDELLRRGAY